MKKINFKISPRSAQPTAEVEKTMNKLLKELDAIIRKHGLDTYLLVVKSQGDNSMYTSAICPSDSIEAFRLIQKAAQTFNELVRTETPTGPGGVA